jgi:hypothetical protein
MIRTYFKLLSILVMVTLLSGVTLAQQQPTAKKSTPQAATTGTNGRIAKYIGFDLLGDSNIFEDKFGKIGIGTITPTSPLTVQGMIETTLGGYKFPDGTVQTTAAISSIIHDASLTGNGTTVSPLGIATGGVNTTHLANNAVTAAKIANSTVVRSLNGLFDNINVVAGANITITPSGNTLTIAATDALTNVAHNTTLTGNGTAATPLSVAVPLNLTGSTGTTLKVEATGNSSEAIEATGGNSATTFGGAGVVGTGGDSSASDRRGGTGVVGIGGTGSNSSDGGRGVEGEGGEASGAGNESGTGIAGFPGKATNGATVGKAGRFLGDVEVLGTVSKAGGSFKIDHPLDPENKYLYHSFVESPDMMNIYNGNVTTDNSGRAVVELPDWFEALNRDFRYQLTVVGQFAQVIVAEKVKGNRFTIQTSAPGIEVSWQVTGVRQDAWANKNRIKVEEQKSDKTRGFYLHPEAFDQPEEKSIQTVQYPERLRDQKQRKPEAEQSQQPRQ